jgi:hypothetical protein
VVPTLPYLPSRHVVNVSMRHGSGSCDPTQQVNTVSDYDAAKATAALPSRRASPELTSLALWILLSLHLCRLLLHALRPAVGVALAAPAAVFAGVVRPNA